MHSISKFLSKTYSLFSQFPANFRWKESPDYRQIFASCAIKSTRIRGGTTLICSKNELGNTYLTKQTLADIKKPCSFGSIGFVHEFLGNTRVVTCDHVRLLKIGGVEEFIPPPECNFYTFAGGVAVDNNDTELDDPVPIVEKLPLSFVRNDELNDLMCLESNIFDDRFCFDEVAGIPNKIVISPYELPNVIQLDRFDSALAIGTVTECIKLSFLGRIDKKGPNLSVPVDTEMLFWAFVDKYKSTAPGDSGGSIVMQIGDLAVPIGLILRFFEGVDGIDFLFSSKLPDIQKIIGYDKQTVLDSKEMADSPFATIEGPGGFRMDNKRMSSSELFCIDQDDVKHCKGVSIMSAGEYIQACINVGKADRLYSELPSLAVPLIGTMENDESIPRKYRQIYEKSKNLLDQVCGNNDKSIRSHCQEVAHILESLKKATKLELKQFDDRLDEIAKKIKSIKLTL